MGWVDDLRSSFSCSAHRPPNGAAQQCNPPNPACFNKLASLCGSYSNSLMAWAKYDTVGDIGVRREFAGGTEECLHDLRHVERVGNRQPYSRVGERLLLTVHRQIADVERRRENGSRSTLLHCGHIIRAQSVRAGDIAAEQCRNTRGRRPLSGQVFAIADVDFCSILRLSVRVRSTAAVAGPRRRSSLCRRGRCGPACGRAGSAGSCGLIR